MILGLLSIFLSCFTLLVLIVHTANVMDNISKPLLDRMEVIDIAGYMTDEKISIARNYLEKDICKAYGIKPEKVFDISLTLLCMHVISLTIME